MRRAKQGISGWCEGPLPGVERSNNLMENLSSFEVITAILSDGQTRIAKEIAKLAREMGHDWTRENANSALYKMLKNSLVVKIETEKAPLWTLPGNIDEIISAQAPKRTNVVSFKSKKLPLMADESLTLQVLSITIQFQFDYDLSPNDSHVSGDWLNDKIFVTLNPHHPFWQTYIASEELKSLQILNIASDIYVQWSIAKIRSEITPSKIHQLRDKALRDLSLS